jgi:RNA polymerase sigma factor (sigma-70 family)
MAAGRSTAELERFVAERADHLLATAVLLTGSREAGEDLLQTAVERLLRRWRGFDGDPESYLRRTLANLAIDGYRRAGRWRQKEGLLRAELRQAQDPAGAVDLRDALVRLLLQLPARQRTVLVLRYWEQLTDAETAAVLGGGAGPGPAAWRGCASSPTTGTTRRPCAAGMDSNHEHGRRGPAPRGHGAVHR